MVLLEAKNLCKYYPPKRRLFGTSRGQTEWFRAVDDVSISLDRGKILVIAGQSGSGKTTFAKLVMGAIAPTSGTVLFEGKDLSRLSRSELKGFRAKVHMVYQDPYSSLDPRMKILDIVREPLDIHDRQSSREQRNEKSLKALEEVKLSQDIANEIPQKLSGGQRQRVSLARAIVLKPRLIVADEPVSMLDVSVRAEILTLMLGLRDKYECAFFYITHDLSTARYVGDSIAVMKEGKIVEQGRIDDVLSNPSHPYTEELIDAIPDIDNIRNNTK